MTNPILKYISVTVTNQFGPFEYAYTNYDGTPGTGFAFPPIKQGDIAALDAKIALLIPKFCITNELRDGHYGEWFAKTSNPTVFPMETMGGLFVRNGIGYQTGISTGAHGLVTAAAAYFTRWPMQATNEWTLASLTYRTNGWIFTRMTDLDTRLYDASVRPVVRYLPAVASTSSPAFSLALTGTALRVSDQAATSVVETVSVATSNDISLGAIWKTISGAGITGAPPSTGDSVVVLYTVPFPLYGDMPYRLCAEDLNERWQVLNALTISPTSYPAASDYKPKLVKLYYGHGTSLVSWASAKSAALSDYQERSVSGWSGVQFMPQQKVGNSIGHAGAYLGTTYYALKITGTWAVTNLPDTVVDRVSQIYFISRPFEWIVKPYGAMYYDSKTFTNDWVTKPLQTNPVVVPFEIYSSGDVTLKNAWYAGTNLNIEFGAYDITDDWMDVPTVNGTMKSRGFGFGWGVGWYPFWCAELWDFKYR
ncbi:MAG: hypothetical protein R6X19_09045 [Kiritimatiellia bacterium]